MTGKKAFVTLIRRRVLGGVGEERIELSKKGRKWEFSNHRSKNITGTTKEFGRGGGGGTFKKKKGIESIQQWRYQRGGGKGIKTPSTIEGAHLHLVKNVSFANARRGTRTKKENNLEGEKKKKKCSIDSDLDENIGRKNKKKKIGRKVRGRYNILAGKSKKTPTAIRKEEVKKKPANQPKTLSG